MSKPRNLPFDKNHPIVDRNRQQKPAEGPREARPLQPIHPQVLAEVDEFTRKFLKTDEKNFNKGILTKNFKNRGEYTGELTAEGKREGKGLFRFEGTQDVYMGDWQNDVFHGKGTYFFSSGDKYEGELYAGMKHGIGNYLYRNGNVYHGEWKQDLKDGEGRFLNKKRGEEYHGGFYFLFSSNLQNN